MRKGLWLWAVLLLAGCSRVMYVTMEQMVPSTFVFPEGATGIAVLNNMDMANIMVVRKGLKVYPLDPDSIKEQVAMDFADSRFFERVVVLDSLLYDKRNIEPHLLSQAEVKQLCQQLNVQMLYVIDYACLTDYSNSRLLKGHFMNAYLVSHLYAPSRMKPVQTFVLKTDSPIHVLADSTAGLASAMSTAYPLLSALSLKDFTPSWGERERMFYSGNKFQLREAEVCVKEGNWEGAAAYWRLLEKSKKEKERMQASFNMALYYEVSDSLDQAFHQIEVAKALASKGLKTDSVGKPISPSSDYSNVSNYEKTLKKRAEEVQKLDLIMRRME